MVLLHSDEQLAEKLGAGIAERTTIHEWPLSCVQSLRLDDGRKLAYKSQLPPTVEAAFYASVSSDLLPACRPLGKLGDCDTLAIAWIDAPLLGSVALHDAELAAYGKRIVAQIGEMRGTPPVYLDIGAPDRWSRVVTATLEKLRNLIQSGIFKRIDAHAAERIAVWSQSVAVLAAIADSSRLTHGDLKADQIFIVGDSFRVIDWQRPVIAPAETDLVSLLIGQGIDALRFVDAAVVGVWWFLRLHWAVAAQHELFAESRWPLFNRWAADAIAHIIANV